MLAQITNTRSWLQFFADNKDGFSAIESLAKVIGIVVAGYWSYLVFIRKREKFPRVKIKHAVAFWDLSDKERIVRVTLSIENQSDVLLRIYEGRTWIQLMKPWPEDVIQNFKQEQIAETDAGQSKESLAPGMKDKGTEIQFPLIAERQFRGEREIEPKESDDLVIDFVIDSQYEQILVYSFVENAEKPGRHLTWSVSSVVNFKELTDKLGPAITRDVAEGQTHQKARPNSKVVQDKSTDNK